MFANPILLRKLSKTRYKDRISTVGSVSYFSYDPIMLYFKPFNMQHYSIICDNGLELTQRSFVSSVGDIRLLLAINDVLTVDQKFVATHLFSKEDTIPPEPHKIEYDNYVAYDYTDYIITQLDEANILSALMINTYSRVNTLSKNREELLSDDIDMLSASLSTFYDPRSMAESKLAWEQIYQNTGISVPPSLSYHLQPRDKISTMFASLTENVTEVLDLEDDFVEMLIESSNPVFVHKKFRKQVAGLTIIVYTEDNDGRHVNYPANAVIPVLPGYRADSDMGKHVLRMGNQMESYGKPPGIYSTLTNKYGGSFDVELAIKVGVRIKSKDKRLLTEYMRVLAIPEAQKHAFMQLIDRAADVLDIDIYSSAVNPASNFAISPTINIRKASRPPRIFRSQRGKALADVIVRDV